MNVRLLLALGALAAFAAPSWPGTVDDVYITLTYARQWAENGALTWTTGERVEGYSNFLFLALMALGVLARLDVDVLAQVVAFVSACGVVALVERALPRTALGALTLAAVVSWAPLAHWSAIGLETTFYTALLAVGWVCILGPPARWGVGIVVLAAASITRPEGALQLVAGLSTVFVGRGREGRGLAVVALVGLAVYHVARISWFGSYLPASYLVKVSPIGLTRYGVQQLLGDLLTAGGIFCAFAVTGRVPWRTLAWVAVPLAIQGATLVRASGDWMSWGRLTLPGVLATAAAFAAAARWRTGVSRLGVVGVAAIVVTCATLEPRGYGTVDLQRRSVSAIVRSVAHLRHGLDTPIAEDVRWVIDNVPLGAEGLVVDAGILGDVPGFRLVDMRGLNHRPAALAIAENRAEEWLRAKVTGPDRPPFLRLANWDNETHPDYPEWLVGGYHLRADLLYGGGSIRWYATTDERPTPDQRRERWDEMLRRHPSHPFLAWHAALSAADVGDIERAQKIAKAAGQRWPSMAEFRDAPRSVSFTSATHALAWQEGFGFVLACGDVARSRMILAGERVNLTTNVRDGARVEVADTCGAAGEELVVCAEPRQVAVRVVCQVGAAGVWVAASAG